MDMPEPTARPDAASWTNRCTAVVDASLPIGKAANAAAVMALTLGARHPYLVGEPLVDADGTDHPGLIPIGIPILGAPADDLPKLREKAERRGLDVVAFPAEGQQTNDYAEFQRRVHATSAQDIRYLGVMLYGSRREMGKVVGKYGLLK